jgi:tyrosinase
VIRRSSESSSVTIPDRHSVRELTKEVTEALEGKREYIVDKTVRHCGLSHGLLLPKGKPEGMKFKLIVVLTDFEKDFDTTNWVEGPDTSISYCGVLGGKNPDKRPMGFPFDRKISSWEQFKTDNLKYTEITIQNVQN